MFTGKDRCVQIIHDVLFYVKRFFSAGCIPNFRMLPIFLEAVRRSLVNEPSFDRFQEDFSLTSGIHPFAPSARSTRPAHLEIGQHPRRLALAQARADTPRINHGQMLLNQRHGVANQLLKFVDRSSGFLCKAGFEPRDEVRRFKGQAISEESHALKLEGREIDMVEAG